MTFSLNNPEITFQSISTPSSSDSFVNFYNASAPPTINVAGRVEVPSITSAATESAPLDAWVGVSKLNTNPNTTSWIWRSANFVEKVTGEDRHEYARNLQLYVDDNNFVFPGVYFLAMRYQYDSGDYKYTNHASAGDWTTNNKRLIVRTQVQDSQANQTYAVNQLIEAYHVGAGTNYRFRVNGANSVNEIITTNNNVFKFNLLANPIAGTTYTIEVEYEYESGQWTGYGIPVQVSLADRSRLSNCNDQTTNGNRRIMAVSVVGATHYRFDFAGTQVVSTVPFTTFATTGLTAGTYSVKVDVSVNGGTSYLNGMTTCQFTYANSSQLSSRSCNATSTNPNQRIEALWSYGATHYRFNFSGHGSITVTTPFVTPTQAQLTGGTYSTTVDVSANGGNTWAIGTVACNYSIPNMYNQMINIESVEQITAYPNPFNNEFNIVLPKGDVANIQLFDINGRLIENRQVQNEFEITMGQNLNTGVYLVRVEQNGEMRSFKMVKK
jgi:hypothetical protein